MGQHARFLSLFLVSLLCISSLHAYKELHDEGKETWGYVTVRPGAHMFFWLYYTTSTPTYTQRPLVLWLQGGPGASSTGIGNFLEIGPLTGALKNRTYAWTREVNVLFVDNPVGTGYSYVQSLKLLPTNNSAVASDLVTFMGEFFKKVPEFEEVPLYIFTESYGGKMGVRFAQSLSKAVQQKKLRCQVAGVVMGDSWIAPVDAVSSWGPYLYATSLVDSAGESAINNKTKQVADAVKSGKMSEATKLWAEAEKIVESVTNGVNFYNILKTPDEVDLSPSSLASFPSSLASLPPSLASLTPSVASLSPNHVMSKASGARRTPLNNPELEHLYQHHVGQLSDPLDALMNGPIKDKLKVIPANVTWGGQSKEVFQALAQDFMSSAVQNVEVLLNTTSLKVVVYNGQLDLIVCTPGAQKWVEGLHWAGTKQWVGSSRQPMVGVGGATVGFSKTFKNFTFYWILNAGHMVPMDAGSVAMRVMKDIVGIKQ